MIKGKDHFYICKVEKTTSEVIDFFADDLEDLKSQIKNYQWAKLKLVKHTEIKMPLKLKRPEEIKAFCSKYWCEYMLYGTNLEIRRIGAILGTYIYSWIGYKKINTDPRDGYYILSDDYITWFKLTAKEKKDLTSKKSTCEIAKKAQ